MVCRRKEPSDQEAHKLEILTEFSSTLEQRGGQKHSNANGLSRQTCKYCRQCERQTCEHRQQCEQKTCE